MKVLVACERSGVVREAFRRRGADAWSCDLVAAEDGSPHHIEGDALDVAGRGGWDMMIAHPPCTYLALSGIHWNARRPERIDKTLNGLDFVRKLMAVPIHRICIENPASVIASAIRTADQAIQPWQFGHDASKETWLWLKNLPKLRQTRLIEPRWVCCGQVVESGLFGAGGPGWCSVCGGAGKPLPRWANQTDAGQNRLAPSPDRAMIRARTYPGIADAMADQWLLRQMLPA